MERGRKHISIVIPVLNEEENLFELHSSLHSVLKKIGEDYEIIFVDDGSTDQSYHIMHEIFNEDKNVRVIRLRRHFGKSAALDAGLTHANGDIIVTIDADLQEDPENIPDLLGALNELDVVCGFRFKRQDPFTKRVSSKIYNWLARRILEVKIHDMNCSLRVFRKEAIKELELLGEMHRYLPALAAMKGFRVGEVKVKHNPRGRGKSKYGFTRLFKGFVDMLTVKFLTSYATRPAHIFGLLGAAFLMIGFVVGLYLVAMKFLYNTGIGDRPLLLLSILLLILGLQMISFGMTAEMTSRIFYSVKKSKPYITAEVLEH